MASTASITSKCPPEQKRTGLTVDDIRAWLADVDRAGIPGTAAPKVQAGMRQQLHRLEVSG